MVSMNPDQACEDSLTPHDNLSTVIAAAADLNSMLAEPERLYASLLERLWSVVPFTTGSLQVMDGDSSRIVAFKGNLDPAVVMGLRFRMNPMFPNYEVVSRCTAVAFADIRVQYPHFWSRRDEFNSGSIRSWLGVPMVAAGAVIGMLALDRDVVDPFSEESIAIAQAFANNAAVAIRNARLYADLQKSLAVQDSMMREMNHRIKNNLQLVSSLIDIQAGRIQDKAVRESLDSLLSRIHAISSLHERLYHRTDMTTVELDSYLGDLAREIHASHGRPDAQVRLELEVAPMVLDVSSAIPLGLITSELVMNALKYAFPPGRAGTVRVSLRRAASVGILTIADDGVGIDTSVHADAHDSDGFGTSLVKSLVAQIEGTIALDTRPGRTAWTMHFPLSSQ